MRSPFRSRALLCLVLALAWFQPALADDKCKVTPIAKFPVTMEWPRATIAVKINGKDVRIWLDSGAFFNFMPKARAVELGLSTDPAPQGLIVTGIGGSFTPELARVRDFGIGGAQLHNMEFVVGGSDMGNGFLGANILGVFDTEFDLAKGAVNLFREAGCSHYSLAYWTTKGMVVGEAKLLSTDNPGDHHIYVEVTINGHALRAILDTGAPDTIVARGAAVRAGIDLASPRVVASMRMGGVGSRTRRSWIARTQTISIGGEEIKNSPIRVVDDSGVGSSDMLLGVDFLISHHVLVSQAQRKMYLTYNGGPIFSVSTDGELAHQETLAVDMGAAQSSAEPTTADEFAGRASGRLTRNDASGALADYGAAIKLAPKRADLFAGRSIANLRSGHPDLATRDIDKALSLSPADSDLLARRAWLRLARNDHAGALADTEAAAATAAKGSFGMLQVVQLYNRLGKADHALALLGPVLDLHHDDSHYNALLNTLSWTRALANTNLDKALKDIDFTLRKSGPSSAFLNTRALVQLRLKAYPAAISDANAALAIAPKSASSLFFRGLARRAGGDEPGGKADIAAARALNPKIDAQFADYGLIAPKAETAVPAQPKQPNGDDEPDQ